MGKQRHFIRAWRKHRELSQEQLAERIGINRAHLSKIETGSRKYDQEFLELAAEALRCEPADLITRDPTAPDPIWTIWQQIPETNKPQALTMLKALSRTGTDG